MTSADYLNSSLQLSRNEIFPPIILTHNLEGLTWQWYCIKLASIMFFALEACLWCHKIIILSAKDDWWPQNVVHGSKKWFMPIGYDSFT